MMESGGLVYMLASLHWALQQLQPRLSGSCRDVAEGRESGERSLGGLRRGQPPYGSSVHRHQFWKVTWPKCKTRRVPNRNMNEYDGIWKIYMKTSYCVSIPFHPYVFFPGSAGKKPLIVQLDRSSWVLHKARLVLPKRLGLADGSSTEFRFTAPKYCRVFGHGSLWIEPADVTGNSIVILHYALIIE